MFQLLLQVQWFFNGTPIQPSDRVAFVRDGDVYYLVIKRPGLADAGTYQCRAETEVSVVTTECTIMVNGKMMMRMMMMMMKRRRRRRMLKNEEKNELVEKT